jgi:putative ABC transport system ATP-binding protein
LITRPSVFFADEPTGALDSGTSRQILGLLREATDRAGQTVVMVTHDPVAAAYADRVLFLADGLIVKDLGKASAHDVVVAMEELSR